MPSKITLSDRAERIKKELDNVNEITDLKSLLQKYEPFEKDFIQKYAETMLTSVSVRMTYKALWLALVLFYGAIVLSRYIQNVGPFTMGIITIIFFGLAIKTHTSDSNDKMIDTLKDIIIAIEDEKLTNNVSSEEDNPSDNQ